MKADLLNIDSFVGILIHLIVGEHFVVINAVDICLNDISWLCFVVQCTAVVIYS